MPSAFQWLQPREPRSTVEKEPPGGDELADRALDQWAEGLHLEVPVWTVLEYQGHTQVILLGCNSLTLSLKILVFPGGGKDRLPHPTSPALTDILLLKAQFHRGLSAGRTAGWRAWFQPV